MFVDFNILNTKLIENNFDAIIYPIPTRNDLKFKLNTESTLPHLSVSLYDLNGRLILNKYFKNYSNFENQDIDIPALSNGIYFVKFKRGVDILTKKIIIAQ